jgi:hypothetical protein
MTGKMTDCCKRLNTTSVIYITLMKQVCVSVYSLVTVLILEETPAMLEQNQNSMLQCSLPVMLMALVNYHPQYVAEILVHGTLRMLKKKTSHKM